MTSTNTSSTAPSAQLRPLALHDLRTTAALHVRTLPQGFFPRLGPGFLEAYHETYLASPYGVATGAHLPGRADLIGFVLGTTDRVAHAAWVRRHRAPVLARRGLRCLLRRPRLVGPFLRTRLLGYLRRLVRRPPSDAAGGPAGRVAVLAHIAVQPEQRGAGAGAGLATAFAEQARGAGATRLTLVTRADSQGATRFYARLGWRGVDRIRNRDGENLIVMDLPVPDLPAGRRTVEHRAGA